LLEWIDKAGYAAVARWSGTYAVTAYVGNVRFTRPVEVGGGATRD
jgi:4-hydroxybenzoyl-CoA thioesterase